MRGFLVLVALGACSTPYQPMGASGGYSERRLGRDRWLITTAGNGFTDRATVIEYGYRRAAELCPNGFDPVDADRSTSSNLATFDGGKTYTNINKSEAMLVVQCHGHKRDEGDDDNIATGEDPVYCTTLVSDPRIGSCFFDETACAAAYEQATDGTGVTYRTCTESAGAACFTAFAVISGKRSTLCAPSVSSCEFQRSEFRRNPDFAVKQTRCRVYRVER